jgi:adenylate cyclase class 2
VSQAREIEVKYRVGDLDEPEAALMRLGLTLSQPVHQDDQAYAQSGWRYGMSKLGTAFARLRTQDGRHLFTLKRPTDNEMACLEFETAVADRDQLAAARRTCGIHVRRRSEWQRPDWCVRFRTI